MTNPLPKLAWTPTVAWMAAGAAAGVAATLAFDAAPLRLALSPPAAIAVRAVMGRPGSLLHTVKGAGYVLRSRRSPEG